MRALLDTHAFIWFIEGNSRLTKTARELIADDQNEIDVSMVSLWEMAIKSSLGKLSLSEEFQTLILDQLKANHFTVLPLSLDNILHVERLPYQHRDPFDPVLAVQSLDEGLPLVSADAIFDAYHVNRIWQ